MVSSVYRLAGKICILHYAVADSTELFSLSFVLDQALGLILKIRLNACCHMKNLCKLGLKPQFGLKTKSGLFFKSAAVCRWTVFRWCYVVNIDTVCTHRNN